MSDFRPCVNCQAPVPTDAENCIACGAAQTVETQKAVAAAAAEKDKRELWSSALLIASIACFALGTGFGFWMRGLDARPAVAAPAIPDEPPTMAEVNNDFLNRTNQAFAEKNAPINLVGWAPGPEGSTIFEMLPPTPEQPAVLWQALAKADREAVMAYFSVSYTKMLIASGVTVDLERDGHPVVILRYRGSQAPVAARLKDGTIRIYQSPFDRAAGAPTP